MNVPNALRTRLARLACVVAVVGAVPLAAQGKRDLTPDQLSQLTLGTPEQQRKAFPPHRIIGNIYSVGSEIQGSFLITTPDGHILVNTNFEEAVPALRGSVEKLGFRFDDIKIILGSHAHGDHMEGDALVKDLTGAQVMAMEQDVPALQRMKPGGKTHPIDRVLHDGDEVTLGGTTLVAHLTAGHTACNTTWTLKAADAGRSYDVVILCGMGVTANAPLVTAADPTALAGDYIASFKFLRSLHCGCARLAYVDTHGREVRVSAKVPTRIRPDGYLEELDAREKYSI